MDALQYKILEKGCEGFFLVSSVENPHVNIAFKGIVMDTLFTDDEKVYYYVKPVRWLHTAGFLSKYVNDKTFRFINDRGRSMDTQLTFNEIYDRGAYAIEFNQNYKHLNFDIPAPMGFDTLNELISTDEAIDTQIVKSLNTIIDTLINKEISI